MSGYRVGGPLAQLGKPHDGSANYPFQVCRAMFSSLSVIWPASINISPIFFRLNIAWFLYPATLRRMSLKFFDWIGCYSQMTRITNVNYSI